MTKKQLLTAAISAALIGGSAGSAFANTEVNIENTDRLMDIQALLQEYIEDNGAVGASVALIDNGKIQFFSYGKKAVSRDELVSEDTVFEIGSVTKVFTTDLATIF